MTLVLTLPLGEYAVTGKQVSFVAPCESHTNLKISIQGKLYSLVDSIGNSPVPNSFTKGAMVSVILNNETSQAFIQNPSTTSYLENKLKEALVPTFVESEKLENIKSGESLPDLFGKISKLFSNLLQKDFNSNVDFTISVESLDSESEPTVVRTTNEDGSYHFTFGIPSGESSEPSAYTIDLTKVVEVDSDPIDLSMGQGFDVSSCVMESEVLSQTGRILIKYCDIRFPGDIFTAEVTEKKYDPKASSGAILVLYATPINPWNEKGSEIKLTISKDGSKYSSYFVYRAGIAGVNEVETHSLNFSNWEGGSFTEILENGIIKTHSVTLVSGIPTEISGITISGVN